MGSKLDSALDTPRRPAGPLTEATVVLIDGNSIAVLAGHRDEKFCHIEAFEHLELDEPVEVTKRLHHPVFMDTYFRFLSGKDHISRVLGHIFRKPVFQKPTVAVLSSEKTVLAEVQGPKVPKSRKGRQAKLLQQLLPLNPYDYPCAVVMSEADGKQNQSMTQVLRVRLADLLPFNKVIAEHAPKYHGSIPALRASTNIIQLLHEGSEDQPVTLCDVGKLRTLYTTALPGGRILHNAIPVGLAGDHLNTARSYLPTIDHLMRLEKALGVLLLSPETSTSFPVESGKKGPGSPQIDCTRFASQIARYHLRSFDANLKEYLADPTHSSGVHYLSGRASRLPGLRQFMEAVIAAPLRRIDRRPIPGISLASGIKWSDLADNLLLVGALLEATSPDATFFSSEDGDFFSPPQNSGRHCSIATMDEGKLYVFEQRLEITPA